MIDAYEIGINLALQDGVSAGLEVIIRELSALDAAVAASASRLQAFMGQAQAAAAVAARTAGPLWRMSRPIKSCPAPSTCTVAAPMRAASRSSSWSG